MLNALVYPKTEPPKGAKLVDLETLLREKPDRCIAVFPESTTTNGRGILPFNPSLLTVPAKTKIFPISLRYTPADITTPVPATYFTFLWNLCSKPTHCIRVRIAEAVYNDSAVPPMPRRNSYQTNLLDNLHKKDHLKAEQDGELNESETAVLDKIAEALARLGRVKRLGLSVQDKIAFVKVWSKRR